MKIVINVLFIFLILFTVIFNIGLIDIRFVEINYLLGKAAFNNNGSNALGIIAKYELIKRRIEHGETHEGNYQLEAQIQALIARDHLSNFNNDIYKKKKYLIPVKYLLNGIRFSLGKEMINPQDDDQIFKVLEIAYFWERNRKYNEAIKLYEDVLSMPGLTGPTLSIVLMHKAFCHSMMSEYKTAKEIYERIISLYPNTESGIISWKLLDFLNSIEKKREEVHITDLSNFEKAKQYYLLMDYRNSIKYFSKFIGDEPSNRKMAEVRYYKGRSHEELGETDQAVLEYRYSIKNDKSKKWTIESNRRLVMLGEFYNYKSKMQDEAKKQLEAYKDGNFLSNVNKFKKIMSTSSIKSELLKKYANKFNANSKQSDEISELINNIGDLELTDDKNQTDIVQKELNQSGKKLIENNLKRENEIKELERKRNLNKNPFRRPSYIKKTINGYVNQLQYIYNKKLRQGVELSGKMVVEISIHSNGGVTSAKIIKSTMGHPEFENEIEKRISTWNFKEINDSLGSLTIRYPFEFSREF
ncbi:MAG: TonB family protein [Chitinispirillia bacterium]|jgi:TonB family protein